MRFDAAAIAAATGGRLVADGPEGAIETDTRRLGPSAWFLALKGARFDGHDWLGAAAAAGALGCVVSREPATASGGLVVVDDTTRALQDLGRAARARLSGPVVGITGSSGKTTTRALVSLALSPLGEVHQTTGNLNNHLGVPMTLLAASEGCAAAVIEMGTSSPGEIAVLADIATPDLRLITNVGPAHLEELGGLDGVATEKRALFRSARPGDVLLVNADDPRLADARGPGRTLTWGRSAGADVQLLELVPDAERFDAVCRWRVGATELTGRLPTPAPHVALDATAALAAAWAVGVDPRQAVTALERYEPVGMRGRVERLAGATVINDAYNANPDSMEASLALLASLGGDRVAVLGDMLELGTDEHAWHARVAASAGSLGLEAVVLVGPRMGRAVSDCVGAGEVVHFEAPEDAGRWLAARVGPATRVLFKGSRGARIERALEVLRESVGPEGGR